jgi:hypothetical protein
MTNWLLRSDFEGLIDLPNSRKDLKFLQGFINVVVREWLTPLIGIDKVKELADHDNNLLRSGAEPLSGLYKLVIPFLVYGSWADYSLVGNVADSANGLVVNRIENSDPISDKQRAETHRYYKGLAESRATDIKNFLAVDAPCQLPAESGTQIRFTSVAAHYQGRDL